MARVDIRHRPRRFPPAIWPRAALAGLIGGAALGLYEMIVTQAIGEGFWTPINMIASLFPQFRPSATDFDPAQSLLGLGLHLAASMLWGLLYAAFARGIAPQAASSRLGSMFLGLLFGVLSWAVMGQLIGTRLAPALRAVQESHFFVAHLVFGIGTALVFYALTRQIRYRVTMAPGLRQDDPVHHKL